MWLASIASWKTHPQCENTQGTSERRQDDSACPTSDTPQPRANNADDTLTPEANGEFQTTSSSQTSCLLVFLHEESLMLDPTSCGKSVKSFGHEFFILHGERFEFRSEQIRRRPYILTLTWPTHGKARCNNTWGKVADKHEPSRIDAELGSESKRRVGTAGDTTVPAS